MSIPFSSAIVAKVCRRSWNRTYLQPARLSIICNRFLTAGGLRGESSITGDGNIHLEFVLSLSATSISTISGGSTTTLLDAFVFGALIKFLPFTGRPAFLSVALPCVHSDHSIAEQGFHLGAFPWRVRAGTARSILPLWLG